MDQCPVICMITDHDIAALCADIYLPEPQAEWTERVLPDDGVAYGIKDFGTAVALVFRGSVTLPDWLCDAEAIADPLDHAGLGPVHPGFFNGLTDLWAELKPELTKKPCIIAGHSLGAARASLFVGLMVIDNSRPLRRVCFGEPRPGFPQAASIIAKASGRSYCNGNGRAHDPVTDVPFTTWIEDYVHPTPLIPVCEPPTDAEVQQDALFAWHSMMLYAEVTPPVVIQQ
jgi:hypothetical protein